jgi:hypothetical protein
MKPIIRYGFVCGLAALLVGCNLLDTMVNRAVLRNLGKGTTSKAVIDSAVEDIAQHAVIGANRETAAISRSLVQGLKGAVDTLNPDIQKAMHLIDSVGQLSNTQVALIMQTVIDRIDHVKGQIKDEQLKQFFMDAITSTTHQVDRQTRGILANMMMKAIDDLNSDGARAKIAAIRDSLLNDATNKRLQITMLTSVQPTLDTLTNRIDRIVNKNIPIVQRYAYQWLLGLGVLAAAIIGWVWYQRRRYLRIVKLLTLQIDKIPDKEIYDELVSRIRHSAQAESLEPVLRTVLQDQGIN